MFGKLKDMKDQRNDWRTSLINYYKELVHMIEQIIAFNKDSVLREFVHDSAYRALYLNELKQLIQKWVIASTATSNNLEKINQLQGGVSNDYFETIDLQSKVREQLKNLGSKSLTKEYDYLWDIKGPKPRINKCTSSQGNHTRARKRSSYTISVKIGTRAFGL